MSSWPSSRRLGQRHCGYKVFQSAEDGRIMGAHILGFGAADMINIFALAISQGLTGKDLEKMPWAYPTPTSDLKYMLA